MNEHLPDTASRADALHIPIIDSFSGAYRFLSNFWPAPTPHRGRLFPTSEHAFAAAKTNDAHAVVAIMATPNPAEAKEIGRTASLVGDWDRLKFGVMEEIVTAKFTHNPELAQRLIATSESLLVEGNTWHDQIWGSCVCADHCSKPGANALGVILMAVRMRLQAQPSSPVS
jgi:ribA/ribD-fused uncharacterized protein